jgi:hypothetical protein
MLGVSRAGYFMFSIHPSGMQIHLSDAASMPTRAKDLQGGAVERVIIRNGGTLFDKIRSHVAFMQVTAPDRAAQAAARPKRAYVPGPWFARPLVFVEYRPLPRTVKDPWVLGVMVRWVTLSKTPDGSGMRPYTEAGYDFIDASGIENLMPFQPPLGSQTVGQMAEARTWW